VISIHPVVNQFGAGPFHRGIKIEDNTFKVFDGPILYALATTDLVFQNNVIQRSETFLPLQSSRDGLTFVACDHIKVAGNKIDPNIFGKSFWIAGGDPSTISIDWPRK
jgi:hypothetical protein